jgi:hypothetical protein
MGCANTLRGDVTNQHELPYQIGRDIRSCVARAMPRGNEGAKAIRAAHVADHDRMRNSNRRPLITDTKVVIETKFSDIRIGISLLRLLSRSSVCHSFAFEF